MELKKAVGKRIKELRIKAKYTQAELAEKVGVASKHQSCIETGKNFPSAELLEKYAKVLNINVLDLLNIQYDKSTIQMKSEIKSMIDIADDKNIAIIHKFCLSLLK